MLLFFVLREICKSYYEEIVSSSGRAVHRIKKPDQWNEDAVITTCTISSLYFSERKYQSCELTFEKSGL